MNESPTDPPDEPGGVRPPVFLGTSRLRSVRRNVWGRVFAGVLVGVGIGLCWVPGEAISGLHLMFLPMILTAYLIGAAMRLPGGELPRQFGLPAAAVALVVCLLFDVCSAWSVYFTQTGHTEDFSLLTALALFPAHWHWDHLLAYALAAAVAYWNSYDRASWKSRPSSAASEAIGNYSAIATAIAENLRQTPPHKQGVPPLVLAAILLVGLLAIGAFGIFTATRTSVRSLVLNPNGKTLAVVQDQFEGEVFELDFTTGQSARKIPAVPYRIVWSPDGRQLAWVHNYDGGKDSPARAELNALIPFGFSLHPALQETNKAFHSLAYSPDGGTLAIGCDNGEVLLWDTGTHVTRDRLQFNRAVECLAFSPTSGTLAAGLSDGRLDLRDPTTLQSIRSWQGHSTEVRRLLFHPEGKVIFSAGARDQTVRAWDPADGSEAHVYPVTMDWITDLSLSPDGATLAVSGGSFHHPGELRLFDVGTGDVRSVFMVPGNTASAVAFSRDGQTLIVGARPPINPLSWPRHGQLHRWDMTSGRELPPLR